MSGFSDLSISVSADICTMYPFWSETLSITAVISVIHQLPYGSTVRWLCSFLVLSRISLFSSSNASLKCSLVAPFRPRAAFSACTAHWWLSCFSAYGISSQWLLTLNVPESPSRGCGCGPSPSSECSPAYSWCRRGHVHHHFFLLGWGSPSPTVFPLIIQPGIFGGFGRRPVVSLQGQFLVVLLYALDNCGLLPVALLCLSLYGTLLFLSLL